MAQLLASKLTHFQIHQNQVEDLIIKTNSLFIVGRYFLFFITLSRINLDALKILVICALLWRCKTPAC